MGLALSSPVLVGRAPELKVLAAALHVVDGGESAAVLVSGDAGIGKTRLVEEFCRTARASGVVVATGVCSPVAGAGLPFGPVFGLRRELVGQLGERVVPPLSPGEAGTADASTAELAKTRLFESFLSSLRQLARQSSVVLVFEDLHWVDSASADFIDFLVRNLSGTRVLVVGTYRADEFAKGHFLRRWLAELCRHSRVRSLSLGGLDRDETAQLIGHLSGEVPDRASAEAVWTRSDGNPFYTEELTAAGGRAMLSPELQALILARVEMLSPDAQALLHIAAVTGRSVDHGLLAAVGTLDAESLDCAIAETVDRHLLVVDAADAAYRFRHALLQEAVEASLLPGERARLHRQLALVLQSDPLVGPQHLGDRAARLAIHWWAAGEAAEALSASLSAAEAAIAVWTFPEAHAHLERALSALDRMSPSSAREVDRIDLLERSADIAYMAGANQRSVDLIRLALDEIDVTVDPLRAARDYTMLGRNAWGIGASDMAFDACREALALLPPDVPSVELARVLAEKGRWLMLMSRPHDGEVCCNDAIAAARSVGARAEEGHALNTLGCCRAHVGAFDEAIALIRESLVIAEELDSPDDLNRAYGNLSSVLVAGGWLEEGAALAFDCAAVGEERWGVRLNGAAGNSVDAFVQLGRYDDALSLLAELGDHALGVCVPAPFVLPAPIAIHRGQFDEARRLLARADELTTGMSDLQQRGAYHMLVAELALEDGRPADAWEEVEKLLALCVGTDHGNYALEARALGVRSLADQLEGAPTNGRRDTSKERLLALELLLDAEEAAGCGDRGPTTSALLATIRAEHSRIDDSDPDLWADAAAQWDAAKHAYQAAYCRWREAEALLDRRGDRARATHCLQLTLNAARQMDVVPLRDNADRLARRARIQLQETEQPTPMNSVIAADLGLTAREVEVLDQVASGKTDREIAEALFISKKTVSVHVSNLLRKLDVDNRVAAGKLGRAHGLG